MEIANLWSDNGRDINNVRLARPDDARRITNLLRHAAYAHLHADWHYPADWLGSPGFVLVESTADDRRDQSLASRLFRSRSELLACLAVAADPPPAGWVRVAAVAELTNSPSVLAALFADVADFLKQEAYTQLGWLQVEPWPEKWITGLGFELENYVETYIREDAEIPIPREIPGLVIRSVQEADLPRLELIEADAFEPLWRHSVASLDRAWSHALSFDVAEVDGQVIGYQFSTPTETGAHMARITVDPSFQGSGVGTQLMAHALSGYQRQGLKSATLNTQVDNDTSQNLYRRFGFRPNGQRFPVWVAALE